MANIKFCRTLTTYIVHTASSFVNYCWLVLVGSGIVVSCLQKYVDVNFENQYFITILILTDIWWPLHINKHRSHWHHLFTRWQEASVWMVSRAIYKYLGCLLINRWVVLSRVVLKTTRGSGRLRSRSVEGFTCSFVAFGDNLFAVL